MSWLRVDDKFPEHKKLEPLEEDPRAWSEVMAVWLSVACHCQRAKTDGRISRARLARITPLGRRALKVADQLVVLKLWRRDGDGYVFHDWDDYQPPAAPQKSDPGGSDSGKAARQRRWRERQRAKQGRDVDGLENDDVDVSVDASVDGHVDAGVDVSVDGGETSTETRLPLASARAYAGIPSRPVPSPSTATPSAGARVHAREGGAEPPPLGETVSRLWGCYERLSAEHGLVAKPRMPGDEMPIRELLEAGWSPPQIAEGLEAVAKRAAAHPSEREWWDGKRCWRAAVLREALAKLAGGAPARGSPRATAAQDPRVGRIEPAPNDSYPKTLEETRAEREAF
ncbi:MAG TPA: hypothetical protein VFG83_16635 [Kofleriaceae bacterium]|nr:hypothetical protein [Kofleriaceae bacterium]